jgi:hypothetical protein
LLENLQEDFLLAGDVMVEAGFLEMDGVGNILHGRRKKALLAEDLGSSLDDVGAMHRALPTGR